MSYLVTIFGGSGFVGRYIARRMAKQGWRVKIAVRRPNEALFVKTYGVVGQVEPVLCNIRDDSSVAGVIKGADAVINCVGILNEVGKNRFHEIQTQGAMRVAQFSATEGVERLIHISAIGSDEKSKSRYSKSKALGERAVLDKFPEAIILRPSVIFGPEDKFFNRFAGMTRLSPFLPLVGAKSKFQPVYVDDVARAAEIAATGKAKAGIYELGGPEVASFNDLMVRMLDVIKRRSIILPLPIFIGRLMAMAFDVSEIMSLGVIKNVLITRDQVKNLARDNVVSGDYKSFSDLGISPTSLNAVLPEYLWCYRPSGQFAAIKDSAKNLRSKDNS